MKEKHFIPQDYKHTPDHLFIDLDRASFDSDEKLESALQTTLINIKENIRGYPEKNVNVIWSGNGYHVHVPLQWKTAIDNMPEFANFQNQDLATRFLRWAERELIEGMADQHHNPSIKSCLFRVPGTVNSKAKNAGLDPLVKVVQESNWKLSRHLPDFNFKINEVNNDFLMKFHSHLVQEVIDDKVEKLERRHKISTGLLKNVSSIDWIDRLLQTGVEDNRKNLLFWVLAPYLITVRGLDYKKAYSILDSWLENCDQVKKLEPDRTAFRYRLRYCLDTTEDQERKPIKYETFKQYYPNVYKTLKIIKGP